MIAGVPYDAEVEYLESTGTQWIDSGYKPKSTSGFRVQFTYLANTAQDSYVLGKRTTATTNRWNLNVTTVNNNDSNAFYWGFGSPFNTLPYRSVVNQGGIYDTQLNLYNSRQYDNGVVSGSIPDTISDEESFGAYIFGENRVGSAVSIMKGRIYLVQFTEGSTLVRDFIPVRFTNEQGQTEGAMYDRVTKKLFRNQGTGSFVIGLDVAKPVMGLHFMKPHYTAKDYVQDGLYYMLDGIENAGYGEHSQSATVWADISDNNRSATFLGANGYVWDDDALYIYGKTKNGIVKIHGVPTMSAFTLEFVFKMDTWDSYARLCDSNAYANTYGSRLDVLAGTSANPGHFSFLISGSEDLNYSLIPVSSSPRSFSIIPVPSGVGLACAVSVDGRFIQTVNPLHPYQPSTPQTYLDVGNRSVYGYGRGFDGKIYAIRCYSRALTAAEIAANYEIDKARFNLPEVTA